MASYWREGVEYAGCPGFMPEAKLTAAEEVTALAGLPHPYLSDLDTEHPDWLAGVDALAAATLTKWEGTPAGRPATTYLF